VKKTYCYSSILVLCTLLGVSALSLVLHNEGTRPRLAWPAVRSAAMQQQSLPLQEVAAALKQRHPTTPAQQAARQIYLNQPLSFVANGGQTNSRVKFLAQGSGYNLFLTADEAVLSLHKKAGARLKDARQEPKASAVRLLPSSPENAAVLRLKLVGANSQAPVEGVHKLRGKSNYFIGNDPRQWHTDVAHYAQVQYQQVYPGIDLIYYGNQRQLEYDFKVAPGANPGQIRLDVNGAKHVKVNQHGQLVLDTGQGEVVQHPPVVYQTIDGQRKSVDGQYELQGSHQVGFRLAAYDTDKPLIIDPILSYSTYLGGSSPDEAHAVAVDISGSIYVTGSTASSDFPVTAQVAQGSLSSTNGNAFVTKIDASGNLIYSTYLGGGSPGVDNGEGIAVDGQGNAYITGFTASTSFPVASSGFAGPQQQYYGNYPPPSNGPATNNGDAFVTKLSPDGKTLVYSTYFGGYEFDEAHAIAIDNLGQAYITGETTAKSFPNNPYFPTSNAFMKSFSGSKTSFVVKYNTTGDTLLYATFLGGSVNNTTIGSGIALDSSNNIYVTGSTTATDFPTSSGCIQATRSGPQDAFVTKLDSTQSGANSLLYSTYLGGTGSESGVALKVDGNGNAIVVGMTGSTNFPTKQALQPSNAGNTNAFLTKLNTTGTGLIFSTYFGGGGDDIVSAMDTDPQGNIYLTGYTTFRDIPLKSPIQSDTRGKADAFITKFDSTASSLVYSTYLGGSDNDNGYGIATDRFNNAYIVGSTASSDFPLQNGSIYRGPVDGFIARINDAPPFTVNTTDDGQNTGKVTLRQAITSANGRPGSTIVFNIPKTDPGFDGQVFTIHPTSALPTITANNTTIDGTSQTHFSGDTNTAGPEIVLSGSQIPSALSTTDGLTLSGSVCTVTGLVINGFNHAINITGTSANHNWIEGNYIGTDPTGTTAVANTVGVTLSVAPGGTVNNNLIGGFQPSATNIIAYNLQDGVQVIAPLSPSQGVSLQNVIRGNRIFSNGGIGINLMATGDDPNTVTENDTRGHSGGGNTFQNFPVLSDVTTLDGKTYTKGFISATPNANYDIDFYRNSSADGSGYGEGEFSFGTQRVTTDNTGRAPINFSTTGDLTGQFVTALATSEFGSTSEFSKALVVVPGVLSLSVNPGTISETAGAGAATGTISRNTTSIAPLVINLTSNNSKIIVPQTVTIPAGSLSATFPIDVVDNLLVDGDVTVTITATTFGFSTATAPITVQDNDVPTLTLSVNPSTFSEAAGAKAAVGTISRNTLSNTALTVNLSNSDPASITVPAAITIPAGATTATFQIGALDNALVDGSRSVTLTASSDGFSPVTATLVVNDNDGPTLTLTVSPNLISETAGANAVVGTLTRNTATDAPLDVALSNSNASRLTMPSVVTIPAQARSVSFYIGTIDNSIADGDQSITLVASVPGFNPGTAIVTVTDNEKPTLTLSVNTNSFSETAGPNAATATLTRNTPVAAALTVNLSSSVVRVGVPATVTFPVGAASITFPVGALDDLIAEGDETAIITASSPGFAPVAVSVVVTDNEIPTLTLSFNVPTISETPGVNTAVGTVTRNFGLSTALSGSLTASDTSAVVIPSTFTIPAGATAANFTVTAVDDAIAQGNHSVTIQAVAGTLSSAANIMVLDNDTPTLTLTLPSVISEGIGKVSGTISRNTPVGAALVVTLLNTNKLKVQGPATVTIPAGASSATFSLRIQYNPLAIGSTTATLTAVAAGFVSKAVKMTITDEEVPTLTLKLSPDRFTEANNPHAARGVLSRNTPTTTTLTATLLSDDANKVRVPHLIQIPAGASSVAFWCGTVDNQVAEGPRRVTVTALSPHFVPGVAAVTVLDNEPQSNLSLAGRVAMGSSPQSPGIGGATVQLFSGNVLLDVTTTATNGIYSFRGLLPSSTCTVIVSKDGYLFTPAVHSFDLNATVSNINFIGGPRLTIMGNVTRRNSDGSTTGLPSVLILGRNGNEVVTARTDSNGLYVLHPLKAGTFLVMPKVSQTFFSPLVRNASVTSTKPTVSRMDFVVAGSDDGSPRTTIKALDKASSGQPLTVHGVAVDSGGTADNNGVGVAYVTVALARFATATATTPNAFWNWHTKTFITANDPLQVEQLASGTTTWSLTGLPTLPAGFYGVRATAVDGASNAGPSDWYTFTIGTTSPRSEASGIVVGSGAAGAKSMLSMATVQPDRVVLRFKMALEAETAADASHYEVQVNGMTVDIESVAYNGSTHSVTIALAEGNLSAGEAVVIKWHDLPDQQGQEGAGQTGVLIVP